MRAISLARIGQYLKTAVEVLEEHDGDISSRELIKEMEKKIGGFTKIELETYRQGGIKWQVVFRFWSIGLVKGNYIKKVKSRWYLTDKGKKIVDLDGEILRKISNDSYQEWKEKNEEGKNSEEEMSDAEAYLEDIDYSTNPPISNMKIKPDAVSFDDILNGVDKSLIQIPPFQREFVWSAKEITYLLDSIYRGYPIGSFIFWKTSKRLPCHRKIGGILLNDPPVGIQIDYVLDGQQRITSLYAAVKGAKIEDAKYEFYFDLSIGRFDYKKIDEQENNHQRNVDILRIPLRKIFVGGPEYHQYIRSFPEKYQGILDDLFFRFKNYSFSTVYVWDEKESREEHDADGIKRIVNIFSRINETGRKLTVVSKMIARCWGENFDLRSKLNELLDNEELEEINEETILQIASVILNDKKSRSKNILEETSIEELENKWKGIAKAFFLAIDFLRNKLRVRNMRYLPFNALIVPLAYFHYYVPNLNSDQSEILFRWFWKACLSNRFGSTVESKIEEDCIEFDKIINEKTKGEFNYPIDWETFRLRLVEQNYSQRNAFCSTVLSLYSYRQPKDFSDNRDIDLKVSFTNYSRHNFHHFFPKAYLEKVDDKNLELKDSIVNIAFAPSSTNIQMGDKAPSEYILQFEKTNNNLKQTLHSHLIGDVKRFGILSNNFELFLEKRAEFIENEFRNLLGLRSKTEDQFEHEPSTPVDAFEILIRNVICQYLQKEYGDGYWGETIPTDIQLVVKNKIEHELKKHPYEYDRYENSDEKLSFLDIMDYQKIIFSNWKIFKDIFGSKSQLEKHFASLKEYRNAIKHKRSLNEVDKKSGEAAILWFEKVFNAQNSK